MKTANQKITPMVWFDNQAEDAVKFYTSAFPNSSTGRITRYGKAGYEFHGQKEGAVMTIEFVLDGQKFIALNAGPIFKINPSISFFATYEQENEVNSIWKKLSDGGAELMPLDKYPWSEKYGWVQDKFGVSWQVSLGNRKEVGDRSIGICLTFTKERYGQAEAAMNLYTSVFKDSNVTGILRHGADEAPEKEGTVKHAQFMIAGQTFMVMDSAMNHEFTFNEGISLVVNCETQEEIDYYWGKLSQGGDPKAQVCGWLKDRHGVSWQVVPVQLEKMLLDRDHEKTERVTKAYLGMKKFDIEELKRAFEGTSVETV